MIVALTAYNRPEYLRETLDAFEIASDALSNYSGEPAFLVARVDPTDGRTTERIADMLDLGRGTYVTVNDERRGHVANIRAAFEDGFALAPRLREDFVTHLSDDLVLSEDALVCAAFMRDTWRDDESVICTCLFSKAEPEATRHREVNVCDAFCSQGFGTWAHRWPMFANAWEPVTEKLERGIDPAGYRGIDRSIREDLVGSGTPYGQGRPILSRIRHIGLENGVHTTPETFESDAPRLTSDDVRPTGEWIAVG